MLALTLVGGVTWRGPSIPLDWNAFLLLPSPLPTPARVVAPMVCLHAFPWKWLLERQMPSSGRNWEFCWGRLPHPPPTQGQVWGTPSVSG